MKSKVIKGVLFDLDGTLLDTEALSDIALVQAFGESIPSDVRNQLLAKGRIPWELKRQILGLRGAEWFPIVIKFAQENWGVADLVPGEEKDPLSSGLPPPPPLYVKL